MKSPSLLLVDDDTAFRQVMTGELSRLGYEVDAVGTGEEAIRRVAAAEPEVVLLDLRLPGMGGLETLKAIQAATPDNGGHHVDWTRLHRYRHRIDPHRRLRLRGEALPAG